MPTTAALRTESPPVTVVVRATALAWAGFSVHNIADLPGQCVLSRETLYPTVVTVGCLAVFLIPATRTAGGWLLRGWTTLNLLGGGLSVLPIPFLPFVPEHSLRHYAFHAVYALCQLPLLWLCICLVRRSSALRLSDAGAGHPSRRPHRTRNAHGRYRPRHDRAR